MFICVDFDGTIVDHAYPNIGEPVPNAIKWLKLWQAAGAKIILFTMRADDYDNNNNTLTQATNYLEDNDIALFGINVNPTQHDWTTSPKAYGHIYVDDAAFGCPMTVVEGFNRICVDWEIVGPTILQTLENTYGGNNS